MKARFDSRWTLASLIASTILSTACHNTAQEPMTPGIGESTAARVQNTQPTTMTPSSTPTPVSPPAMAQSSAAMPSQADIQRVLDAARSKHASVTDGKNADYIPALAKVDSKLFGIAVVLANGEVVETGDTKAPFAIESISKVFALSRLIEDKGAADVEKAIGVNATGQPFNSVLAIELNQMNKEHPAGNPFVNAGAITTVALVPARSGADRWDRIKKTMDAFAGRELTVDQEVYKSETATNTHNRGIAYLLQSYEVIKGDPSEALDIYTRECSVSVTARDLAMMGATLANGGTNPVTHQKVVSPDTASHVLAMMMTGGLYETTGAWVYRVGVPAKSGVGGGILAVVPGKYAIAAFSPPLDKAGNSVRAQRAIESIVHDMSGSLFAAKPMGGSPTATKPASGTTPRKPATP